jgi:ribonucleoside-diphosphate reductase beta chain
MQITHILKRDGGLRSFREEKITAAILKAMEAVGDGSRVDAEMVTQRVLKIIGTMMQTDSTYTPSIEGVQNVVEDALMSSDFHGVAKAYILYRQRHSEKRKTNIFEKRVHLKPYEYPDLLEYVDAIRHSYWIHSEFNFTSDIQDFKALLTEPEREAIKRAMLAISQVEVAVKTFWGDIYDKLPKPEIGSIGATFSESEVRHQDAYSHLLEILGLNEEFKNIKKNSVIMNRVRYLESALKNAKGDDNREYAESILLFSLFIEHVSLFSQFFIIMAFNKHKNVLKGISNVVEATSKEEQIHGNFGIDVIKIIKAENPSWFSDEFELNIKTRCKTAYRVESEIIDWIFEKGELDFVPVAQVKEFIKNRFNNSLRSIGIEPILEIDDTIIEQTEWFDDEIIGTKHGDFFVKRSVNYNKRSQSITSDDLF